jgi:hypothetical protein
VLPDFSGTVSNHTARPDDFVQGLAVGQVLPDAKE